MKKMIFASAMALLLITTNAQTSKIPVGKKLQLLSETKINTTVSMMGQEMEVPATTKTFVEVNVKAATATSVTAVVTTKKIGVNLSMMGQETSFDSDDKNIANNPAAADALKNLNKPEEVIIENGKLKGSFEIGIRGMMTSGELAKKMFLTLDAANITEGFKWTEENNTDGSKINTIYTVTKVTATDIEVTATSNIKIAQTIQQMGMDMKQNTSGTISAVSLYDATTAILKADATKIDMTGTMNVMGNDAPISIKIITTSTVK